MQIQMRNWETIGNPLILMGDAILVTSFDVAGSFVGVLVLSLWP